jgi:hypothetical protein
MNKHEQTWTYEKEIGLNDLQGSNGNVNSNFEFNLEEFEGLTGRCLGYSYFEHPYWTLIKFLVLMSSC